MKSPKHHPAVAATPAFFTVQENVLSTPRCEALIDRFQLAAPKTKPVVYVTGEVHRNTKEMEVHDLLLADVLGAALRDVVPPRVGSNYVLTGVASRFRIFEHKPGCFFGAHEDGEILVRESMSFYTLIVYLNGDVSGGETVFDTVPAKVIPATGRAVVFNHATLHRGAAVTAGVKYLLRGDVMYHWQD